MFSMPLELAKVKSMHWFLDQEECEEIASNLFQTNQHIIQVYTDHVLIWDSLPA
jgi:hypothetical protein